MWLFYFCYTSMRTLSISFGISSEVFFFRLSLLLFTVFTFVAKWNSLKYTSLAQKRIGCRNSNVWNIFWFFLLFFVFFFFSWIFVSNRISVFDLFVSLRFILSQTQVNNISFLLKYYFYFLNKFRLFWCTESKNTHIHNANASGRISNVLEIDEQSRDEWCLRTVLLFGKRKKKRILRRRKKNSFSLSGCWLWWKKLSLLLMFLVNWLFLAFVKSQNNFFQICACVFAGFR